MAGLLFRRLVTKHIFRLGIQLVGVPIDEFDIAPVALCPGSLAQVLRPYGFDERGSRWLRPRDAVNAG
jgi:hypothetical protein